MLYYSPIDVSFNLYKYVRILSNYHSLSFTSFKQDLSKNLDHTDDAIVAEVQL